MTIKDEKIEAIVRKVKGLLATAEGNANGGLSTIRICVGAKANDEI